MADVQFPEGFDSLTVANDNDLLIIYDSVLSATLGVTVLKKITVADFKDFGPGSWDVHWPLTATDGNFCFYDWATGKIIKDSWMAIDSVSLSGSSVKIPLSSVVKAYIDASISTVNATISSHTGNTSNPHNTTKSQVWLGNVTNDVQLKAADLDTDSTFAANSDTKVPSQKAVKTKIDSLTKMQIAAWTTNQASAGADSTSTTSTTYVKLLSWTVQVDGTYTLWGTLQSSSGSGSRAYYKIYKNWVAYWSEKNANGSGWWPGSVSVAEDLSFLAWQTIEIRMRTDATGTPWAFLTGWTMKYKLEAVGATVTMA